MPNADMEGRAIKSTIEDFCKENSFANSYTSLGQLNYLSCIQYVDAVVGNSSSGLIEVPSFNKATINIGSRQFGRVKADSIIDCLPEKNSIKEAIKQIYNKNFQNKILKTTNPYGTGGASKKIVKTIINLDLDGLFQK